MSMPLAWLGVFLFNGIMWPHSFRRDDVVGMFLTMIAINGAIGASIIAGALAMRKCRAYELAIIASVLAVLPITNIAFFLCLPMGIWALCILSKRDVRAAFARRLRQSGFSPKSGIPAAGPVPAERAEVVRQRVTIPAVALGVIGFLQCLIQVFWLIGMTIAFIMSATSPSHDQHPWMALALFGFVWGLIGLGIGARLIWGGARMMQLRSYPLARNSCVLAMLPFSPVWVLALPIAIWALSVLTDEEVKAGFGLATRRGRNALGAADEPERAPTGPVRRRVRDFLRSVRTLFYSSPGMRERSALSGSAGVEDGLEPADRS
jgi:hypothetical protein